MALTNCRHCDTPNQDTSRFCASCGEPLRADSGSRGASSAESSLAGTRTHGRGTSPPPAEEEPGRAFGPRYRLLYRLGKGGMGEVWKARDLELNHLVALKMIRPELLEDPDLVDRFKHEITLARKVTHKNVCRIHDLGDVEGTRFISMEYMEGKNLKQFMDEEGPLPEEKAIPIIRGICEGLKAAHEAGVVHRDLKPQNILIDHDGVAHIMDFGIAFSGETAGITRTGALIGTPEYMSPEQVRGERLDVRSDIYSLGLIFYEMVTKDLPFTSDSVASSMYKRLSEKPRKPREIKADIPTFLEKIILRCLEKERAFRYVNVDEILADIQKRQAPGLSREYLGALARQRRGLLAALGLLLVAGITLSALFQKGVLSLGRGAGPAALGEVSSIAVLPFQNLTGDPKSDWLRAGLANLLTTDLAQARGIRVVSSARLAQILNDLHLGDLKGFDAGTLTKVAEFLDAQMVLTGTFTSMGETLRVDAEVFRIKGQEAVQGANFKVTAQGEKEFLGLVDTLARQVRESMGATPAQIQEERPKDLQQVISASVPAVREYTSAVEQLHRGGYLEAVEGFKRAIALDAEFTLAHARLGEAYQSLGRDPEAAASLDTAVGHLERASERETFVIKALQASLKHDLPGAIRNYEELVKLYPNDPESYFSLAAAEEQADDYDKAVVNYQKAIQRDDKYAAAYFGLGRAQFRLGEFDAALKSFNSAVGLQDQTQNEEGKATALNGLGAVYYQMGRDEEAIQYYRQSAEIKKRIGDLKGYANSLNNIAQAYRRSGKFDDAINAVQESIQSDRSIGNRNGECAKLESLGSIYLDAGRFGDSLKAHQESLRIAREIGDEPLIAANLGNIGSVYSAQGRYADAEVYYQQALEKRRATGDKDGILRSLVDLGNLQMVEGADDKALDSYLEGMKLAREIDDLDVLVALSLNLAELYINQGHYRAAGASLSEALKLIGTSEDQYNLVLANKFSADLSGRLGRLEEAESKIADAGRIADTLKNESLISDVLCVKGGLRLRQRRLPDAAAEFRRALDFARRSQDSVLTLQARIGLGLAQALAGEAAALKELQQSAEDADSLGNSTLILHSQVALARAAMHANREREAEAAATKILARDGANAASEPFFQAHLIRGLCALSSGRADQAGSQLGEALQVLEKLSGELPDPAAAQRFFSRPDLKADLVVLSQGLDRAGRKADAAKVAAWAR